MSLGTFLKKIWEGIKDLFDGLLPELKQAIHIGVTVVENIKNVIDNPVVDILTAIIPTDIDDKVKEWLRAELPNILKKLKLVEACSDETDPNRILQCALKTLEELDGDFKSAFLHDLSILIAQVAADGKLDWKDATYLLQWYYDHKATIK
ncbi:hypothetical protein F0919_17820 [Taibaiella lutea]|uniref:Uncharacterized protein n=1 Tax=Taibaiella lutea TaxID=2608001 RepID=A0A5M6CHL7_9BACT|nr:hypothetical protein [Taibaiella lutea]KAA5532639.1 hypothetical protein F0919_17820 [Taibaiella lutea]